MKRANMPLLVLTLLGLFTGPALAAATYHWIGGGGDSWPAPGNWSPTRVTPATDDILVFDRGDSMAVVNVPNVTVGQVLVTSGRAYFISNGTGALTVGGGTGEDLVVSAGCMLVFQGAVTMNVACATGTTGSVSGTLLARGGAHRLFVTDSDALAIKAGGVVATSTDFTGNLFGDALPAGVNSVRFQAGSLYVQGAGANPFGFAAPQSAVVFEPGSRFRLDAGSPAASGRTYADFELNVPGTATMSGASAVTMDSLIVTRGSLSIVNASARFNGAIRVKPGASLAFSPASPASYTLGGTTPQWIRAPGTRFLPSSNVKLVIDNAADVYVDSTVSTTSASFYFVHGRLVLPDILYPTSLGRLEMQFPGVIENTAAWTGWVVGNVGVEVSALFPDAILPVGRERYAPITAFFRDIASTFRVNGASLNIDQPGHELAQLRMDRLVHATWSFDHTSPASYSEVEVTVAWDPADADPGIDVSRFALRKIKNQYYLRAPLNGIGAISAQTKLPFAPGPVHWNFAAGESAVVQVDGARVAALEAAGAIGIPVELSQASIDTVFVQFTTVDSTAFTANSDYTTTSGMIEIPPQDTTRTVSVPVGDDATNENDESFLLTFPSVLHAVARDRGEGVILNDDPNQAPSMTVVSPSGGNHYVVGTHVNIVWNSNDDLGVTGVDLLLSRDGGADFEEIASGIPNTHNYDWVVTGPVTNRGVIRGVAHDGSGLETADDGPGLFFIDDVVGVTPPALPTAFALEALGPNPVHGEARFSIALPKASRVDLSIVDVRGRRVATIASGDYEPGIHPVLWNARDAAAGIYFARFRADGFAARERFVLLR